MPLPDSSLSCQIAGAGGRRSRTGCDSESSAKACLTPDVQKAATATIGRRARRYMVQINIALLTLYHNRTLGLSAGRKGWRRSTIAELAVSTNLDDRTHESCQTCLANSRIW